jgi:drug/metabolite transporter (DMT)-like permease
MKLTKLPIQATTFLYLICYVPYILIARALSTTQLPGLNRALSGLETLPPVMIVGSVFTLAFVILARWTRSANQLHAFGVSFPWPRWVTFISGIGTAMLLFTVPLSLTFKDVSIPFMQLIMRGDVLIIAPLVDLVSGRRVRWWSWVALVLVAIGLVLTVGERGGLHMPPLAILTVVVYTAGYFVRLAIMTKAAKSGRDQEVEAYFVEEKMVAMPLAVVMLAAVALTPFAQGADLSWGFAAVWTSSALPLIVMLSFTFFLVSVFSALILLDKRENTFCVPFERAGSIVAGIVAAFLLAIFFGEKYPTPAEVTGSSLLILAILLLSFAPRFARRPIPVAAGSNETSN